MTSYIQVRFLLFLFAIVSAIMLYGAVGEHGPEYYSLLRLVTCFAAVLVAIFGARWGHIWATVVFSFVAILLNPFIQIELSQSMWRPIDVGIAMLFLLAISMARAPGTSEGKWRVLTLGVPLMMALVFAYGLGWIYIYGPYKAKETLTNRLMECIEDVPVEFRGDVEAAIRYIPMTAGYDYGVSAWSMTGPGLMPTPVPPRAIAPAPQSGREYLRGFLYRLS